MKPSTAVELTVITKAYDLVRELTRRTAKFPRDYKFLLGDRILVAAYEMFDLLLEAKYTRDKLSRIDTANLRLERLRFQARLAHDERLLSTHQYEVVARLIDEVGRLVGGWRRAVLGSDRRRQPPADVACESAERSSS